MSKSNTQKAKRVLTPNEIKAIIISVICLVMIAVLVVSLVLVLKPDTSDDSSSSGSDSSTSQAYIKNGDFTYSNSSDTTYPKTAQNWTKYTYKAPEDSTHGFATIDDDSLVIAGIVDTSDDTWSTVTSDLANLNITNVTNPGIHNSNDDLDTSVYMFATKEATTASIVSASFSVSSQTSAKITVWVNTSMITSGNAIVAIQKYSSSSLSALESARYAYEFNIENASGWQQLEFYVFNRKSSSESVVVNVGIGNTYTGDTAEGILFVDDITYETVSANEYRKFVDESDGLTNATRYATIGMDDITDASDYATLTGYGSTVVNTYTTSTYPTLSIATVENQAYSPFTSNDKFNIYQITNDGSIKTPVALVLDTWNGNPIVVKSSEDLKDHLHMSFWVRVAQSNVVAQGNIVVQSLVDGEWTDLSSGSFTSIVTGQTIEEDDNCGWTKYEIYIKPTTAAENGTQIRVLFALGNTNGYASTSKYTPNGSLFVTSPYVEEISSSTYTSATSGTYIKKVSLVGDTSSTTVTNGSFSNLSTSNPDQPSSWLPVFAGDNRIYKDGQGNVRPSDLPTSQADVTSLVIKNNKGDTANGESAPYYDDSEQNYLKITNNVATSYGYLSSDITLSSHTVYSFSVLAKTTGDANPYFYVVKSVDDRTTEDAILGKIDTKVTTTNDATDAKFALVSSSEEGNGWTRYYIVIITGDDSLTARVALFNGSIDGTTTQSGTVYYDNVTMTTIGSYTIDTTVYEDGDEDAPATNRDRITFTASSGYSVFEKLTTEEISTLVAENANINVSAEPDWNAMVENAMATTDDDDEEETTTTTSDVNIALLLSVISSVALVAALLIVIVIRLFRRRNANI